MTADEWERATDKAITATVRDLGPRRARLLTCHCCRLLSHVLPPVAEAAIALIEDYADEGRGDNLRKAARAVGAIRLEQFAAIPRDQFTRQSAVAWALTSIDLAASQTAPHAGVSDVHRVFTILERITSETARQRTYPLFKDLYLATKWRNPSILQWRTSTAVAITARMYESRDFGPMPILGDALQDAGCEDAAVLDHCRGPGPHVRGCWVVDLVLGK